MIKRRKVKSNMWQAVSLHRLVLVLAAGGAAYLFMNWVPPAWASAVSLVGRTLPLFLIWGGGYVFVEWRYLRPAKHHASAVTLADEVRSDFKSLFLFTGTAGTLLALIDSDNVYLGQSINSTLAGILGVMLIMVYVIHGKVQQLRPYRTGAGHLADASSVDLPAEYAEEPSPPDLWPAQDDLDGGLPQWLNLLDALTEGADTRPVGEPRRRREGTVLGWLKRGGEA